MNDSINMSSNDEVSKDTSNFVSKLSIDNSGHMWNENLLQLRCFVPDDFNLTGKWPSPGGESIYQLNERDYVKLARCNAKTTQKKIS